MYFRLFFLIFILSSQSFAETNKGLKPGSEPQKTIKEHVLYEEIRFTPHISAESYTRPKGKFSLQRAVGANLNTSLFLTSLNYSVSDRFEIGTILIHYFNELNKGNISFKYNFWRKKHFIWSVGFNYAEFELDEEDLPPEFQNRGIGIGITSIQLLLNYFPDWTPLRFGFNINGVDTRLTNVDQSTEELSTTVKYEFGVDISYPFHEMYDATLGFGWLRDSGVTATEEVNFGFGGSFRWYRPGKLFSSPTLGAHFTPETSDVEFLFSTSLY